LEFEFEQCVCVVEYCWGEEGITSTILRGLLQFLVGIATLMLWM